MKLAGDIAKKNQEEIDLTEENSQKNDAVHSIVTKTDLEISELFEDYVKNNFSNINYIVIDEEKVGDIGNDVFEKIKNTEFTFVIDPIDGTLPYSLKMLEYGISIGVLHYGKPYIGVIYCPNINELVYFDGKASYWMQNAFARNEKLSKLVESKVNSKAIIFDSPWNIAINDKMDFSKNTVMGLYSIVMDILYIATGRGKSAAFGVFPWDMAGGWPILKNLGFELINYKTKKVLNEVSDKDFASNMRVKDIHIICKEEDFDYLKRVIDLRW